MFGENLRTLCAGAPSIAGLCRELGINRTQFNRYLAGESFPRPDVLHRICAYFQVDARILLEPVDSIAKDDVDLIRHPEISEFIGAGQKRISEQDFPNGLYRFSRPSFMNSDQFVVNMVRIYRRDGYTFIRGLEPRVAMRAQGLPDRLELREYRGFVLPQESGIAFLVARRGSMTVSYNFLARVPSFDNNFWVGYAARTVPENVSSKRVVRMALEHLGTKCSTVLSAARGTGFCTVDELPPFHRQLLEPDRPFR